MLQKTFLSRRPFFGKFSPAVVLGPASASYWPAQIIQLTPEKPVRDEGGRGPQQPAQLSFDEL